MESDCWTSSESHPNKKKHINDLEEQLKNCSLEIGYLQDELGECDIEVNCMGEHVNSLELKIAVMEMLHEKVNLLSEELLQSDARCLRLTQEIESKDQDLKNCLMRVEELEAAISSSVLESQCDIESLRLDMIAMEERCLQAESLSQQMIQDNAKMHEVLEEYEKQLHQAHDTIGFLEMENNELKVKLQGSERQFRGLHSKFEEHLSSWLSMYREPYKNFSSVLKERHSSLNGTCICEEVLCPLVPKLFLLTTREDNVKNEMQEMANQIRESELLVEKLKEELRKEKLRSKEIAEDLTQAMAELRYEITGMLEEECKHRASIEEVSLRRIQDLEEEVRKEQRKSLSVTRLLQEVHKLSGTEGKS